VGAHALVDVVPLRSFRGPQPPSQLPTETSYRRSGLPLRAAAFVVAFSRVYTGVHYLGDVLVAAAVGSMLGRLTSAVARHVRRPGIDPWMHAPATSQRGSGSVP
jgi:membrane-associated phospholipid phosphatase